MLVKFNDWRGAPCLIDVSKIIYVGAAIDADERPIKGQITVQLDSQITLLQIHSSMDEIYNLRRGH